jgi:hypothetical protein
MKNYIQNWRSSILSESNPLMLNEGIFDLGLPAIIPETINLNFEGVPEKGKTMIGNLYKNQVFNELTRGYAMPLMNDVVQLSEQIFDSTLDLFTGDKALDKIPKEDKEKLTQFLKNVRNTFVGVQFVNPNKRANYSEWRTKVGDIQKAIKMVKKGYSRGIIQKLIGDTTDVKAFPEMFETLAEDIYDDYARAIGQMTLDVQTWLKSHPDEYKKIPKIIEDSDYYPDTALIKYAQNWLHDVEQEEQKIHTFDDTSYWYDLQTDTCPIEAGRMGHCGGDGRATTLFSLRYKGKNQQKSGSYVTVAYNPDTDSIYQIKGKFNKAPEKKYYEHIAWLIQKLGNPQVFETGEHSDDTEGFEGMSTWLKKNTDAKIEDPMNAWDEMRDSVLATMNTYNDMYFYSKIFVEMNDPAEVDEPSYYFRGYVGIPIELEELSEEGQQRLKDSTYTRDDIKVITRNMDDPRATGKFTGGGAHPVKIDGDYAIFFFDAADLVTSGVSEGEWALSTYDGDIRSFADDVLNMDREASVSGNRLQQDLVRALIATRFMDGGPFLNLFMGARSGELQEDSDWIVETDVDGEDDPKLVWFQTPEISFDLKTLKQGGRYDLGDELEYYRKPQVVEKILNSNTFKEAFMLELSKGALTTETQMPDIQVWEVTFENYNPPQFVIEAAWQVDKDDNESKATVAELWLNGEFGKSDFEQMLHSAFNLVLEEAIGDEELGSQKSMDFPGGKRLPINESVSHKDIIKNWKNFKGF